MGGSRGRAWQAACGVRRAIVSRWPGGATGGEWQVPAARAGWRAGQRWVGGCARVTEGRGA
eukprot:354239-Chlamydomonas_euryale.AAC.5